MKSTIFLLLAIVALSGCSYGGNRPWEEGLWLVPLLPFLGALWFLGVAWHASKKDETWEDAKDDYGRPIRITKPPLPFTKQKQFIFGVVLLVAAILLFIIIPFSYA